MDPVHNKKIIIEIFAGVIIILIAALIIAKKEKSPAASGTPRATAPKEFNYKDIIESLTPPPVSIPNVIQPSPKIIKSLTAPAGKNNIGKQELEKILQSLTP